MAMEVAKTILSQLGGNKFLAMTGSCNLAGSENSLSMKLRKNNSKANYFTIKLNSMDTYDLKFIQCRANKVKTIKELEGIYCDQLQEIFTEVTGLYTYL